MHAYFSFTGLIGWHAPRDLAFDFSRMQPSFSLNSTLLYAAKNSKGAEGGQREIVEITLRSDGARLKCFQENSTVSDSCD